MRKTSGVEQEIQIPWDEGFLDARLHIGTRDKPVALLMHGANNDMNHPLITGIAQGLMARGWTTIRFNFGFVETHQIDLPRVYRELLAAEEWLRNRRREMSLFLIGKSLGAFVATHRAARGPGIRGILALGYPFQQQDESPIDQDHLRRLQCPWVIVQGTRDPFGPPERVNGFVQALPEPPTVIWIEGTGHSFTGQESKVVTKALQILQGWESLP